MSYNHLTLTERARIEVLRQENYSLRCFNPSNQDFSYTEVFTVPS
ncbi:helix-turn-helix domain-containing protein, partial [Staphylococcus aureus]|nr:helix-turn-helix domain-containing protein [Staphylococcus aureus]